MITVMQTRPSKSGKTIGVLDQDDIWYSCKDFGIASLHGQAIMVNWSQQNFDDGGSIKWINDYSQAPGQPMMTPVPQPAPQPQMQQPVQAPVSPPAPSPAHTAQVDRDASIVAQTLCKTVTFTSITDAWYAYCWAYNEYLENPPGSSPNRSEEGQMQAAEHAFNDDIPFGN